MRDSKVRVWWRNLNKKGKRGINARQSHTSNVRRELREDSGERLIKRSERAAVYVRPLDPRDGNEWQHIGEATDIDINE